MLPLEVPSGARILTVRVSSLSTEVYDPKAFILHAALLGQAFAHCPIFLTAASRRSLDRVSVPVWLIVLSEAIDRSLGEPLPRQQANQTRAHPLAVAFKKRPPFPTSTEVIVVLFGISSGFPGLSQT